MIILIGHGWYFKFLGDPFRQMTPAGLCAFHIKCWIQKSSFGPETHTPSVLAVLMNVSAIKIKCTILLLSHIDSHHVNISRS